MEDREKYIFRKATADEVQTVFQLVLNRIHWMDEKGIRQWNVTDYVGRFPLSYYEQKQAEGEMFVLEEKATGQIVCGAILKEVDDRWPEDVEGTAYYLHNFATDTEKHGVGLVYLHLAEQYAAAMGKQYFRLDCAVDNAFLNHYYDAQGYVVVGHCVHGLYRGLLREKRLA
jgi:hypothetical protein